jgi:hypothetical protein
MDRWMVMLCGDPVYVQPAEQGLGVSRFITPAESVYCT